MICFHRQRISVEQNVGKTKKRSLNRGRLITFMTTIVKKSSNIFWWDLSLSILYAPYVNDSKYYCVYSTYTVSMNNHSKQKERNWKKWPGANLIQWYTCMHTCWYMYTWNGAHNYYIITHNRLARSFRKNTFTQSMMCVGVLYTVECIVSLKIECDCADIQPIFYTVFVVASTLFNISKRLCF